MNDDFFANLNAAFASSLDGAGNSVLRKSGAPRICTATVEYVLMPEHLAEYVERRKAQALPSQKSDAKDVHVLRARHHQVARLLAAGLPETVVAELTNFDAGYLSVLKNSPSMTELIAHYRAPGNAMIENMAEKLRLLGDASLNVLLQKLEAGELTNNELLQAIKLGVDRSGNGPASTINHNHEHRVIDVAELAQIALKAKETNRSRLIPLAEVRQALPAPGAESEPEEGRKVA